MIKFKYMKKMTIIASVALLTGLLFGAHAKEYIGANGKESNFILTSSAPSFETDFTVAAEKQSMQWCALKAILPVQGIHTEIKAEGDTIRSACLISSSDSHSNPSRDNPDNKRKVNLCRMGSVLV